MSVVLNASSFAGPGSSFTIPYNTLRAVSTELVDVKEGLDRMKVQMVSALLSTVFIGAHTACAAYAAKVQIDRGVKRNPRALLVVTVAMYTATFVSWVTLLVSQFKTLSEVKSNVLEAYSWVPPEDCFVQHSVESLPGYCTTLPDAPSSIVGHWDSTQGCVGTGALTFNVVLGDAVVWWRVWVLWNKNRPIFASCCFVLLATLVFGALDTAVSCASGLINDPLGEVSNRVAAGGAFFEGNFFGLCAIAVSLFSNSAATLLVGYKAWKHRLRAKKHFEGVESVGRTQRVLMLLVESGVAYCLLWALVLSSNASWVISSPALSAWSNIMLYFTEGCIVALVGIYPTLIIVLVALDKSEIAKQTLAWSPSSLPSLPSIPVSLPAPQYQYSEPPISDAEWAARDPTHAHARTDSQASATEMSEIASDDGASLLSSHSHSRSRSESPSSPLIASAPAVAARTTSRESDLPP